MTGVRATSPQIGEMLMVSNPIREHARLYEAAVPWSDGTDTVRRSHRNSDRNSRVITPTKKGTLLWSARILVKAFHPRVEWSTSCSEDTSS